MYNQFLQISKTITRMFSQSSDNKKAAQTGKTTRRGVEGVWGCGRGLIVSYLVLAGGFTESVLVGQGVGEGSAAARAIGQFVEA